MGGQQYRFSNYDLCSLTGSECKVGIHFLYQLKQNVSALGETLDDGFELSGHVCLEECKHGCTAAFRCSKDAVCFLGDIDPDRDIDELFAEVDNADFSSTELSQLHKVPSTFMRLEKQARLHC